MPGTPPWSCAARRPGRRPTAGSWWWGGAAGSGPFQRSPPPQTAPPSHSWSSGFPISRLAAGAVSAGLATRDRLPSGPPRARPPPARTPFPRQPVFGFARPTRGRFTGGAADGVACRPWRPRRLMAPKAQPAQRRVVVVGGSGGSRRGWGLRGGGGCGRLGAQRAGPARPEVACGAPGAAHPAHRALPPQPTRPQPAMLRADAPPFFPGSPPGAPGLPTDWAQARGGRARGAARRGAGRRVPRLAPMALSARHASVCVRARRRHARARPFPHPTPPARPLLPGCLRTESHAGRSSSCCC